MQVNIITAAVDAEQEQVVRPRRNISVVRRNTRRYAFDLARTIKASDVREHAIEFVDGADGRQLRAFIGRMTAVAAVR